MLKKIESKNFDTLACLRAVLEFVVYFIFHTPNDVSSCEYTLAMLRN